MRSPNDLLKCFASQAALALAWAKPCWSLDSIVSRDTVEQEFALNRQLFLCEQGYEYRIVTLPHPGAALPEEYFPMVARL